MADDYSNDFSTTGRVVPGGEATGKIDFRFDEDWFKVTLKAGVTYAFDVHGRGTDGAASPYEPALALYGRSSEHIISNFDIVYGGASGTDRWIYYTPAHSGTYYLGVMDYMPYVDTYTVEAMTLTDDYLGAETTTGVIALGGQITGNIDSREDADWFRIELQAGTTYSFDLRGVDGNGGTLGAGEYHAPKVELYGPNSVGGIGPRQMGGVSGKTGSDPVMHVMPTVSGTYYVGVSESLNVGTGTYTLRAALSDQDDYAGNATTIGTLTVDSPLGAHFMRTADDDWFKVELQAGTTYRMSLQNSGSNNVTLSLYHPDGTFSRSNDYVGADPNLYFRPTISGAYYVSAKASFGAASYTVQVATSTTVVDDHGEDAHTDSVLAIGGSTSGRLDYKGDADWFKVALQGGTLYEFELRGADGNIGTLNLGTRAALAMYTDTGANLFKTTINGAAGGDAVLQYLPKTSGTYHVRVYEQDRIVTGGYTLRAKAIPGIDAGDGVDTVVAQGARADFQLRLGPEPDTWTLRGDELVFLKNVERLGFTDGNLALDLRGNAGMVAKTIGAVLGPDAVANPHYVGIGLEFIDAGATYEELMSMALDEVLGANASNAQVVDQIYRNVVGVAPHPEEQAMYESLLDSGAYTQASIGVYAADTDFNTSRIDLIGLMRNGLPFDLS